MGTTTLPGIDVAGVTGWFAGTLGVDGPLELTLIAGGHSNLTYRVEAPDGSTFALRRPPTGALLPTAHDVAREWRIISALGPGPVPVPRARGLCQDGSVTGANFYVMDYVDGTILDSDVDAAVLEDGARRRVSAGCVDVLAALHDVPPGRAGFAPRPDAEPYVPRQLRRWMAQVERVLDGAAPDAGARALREVHDLLASRVPPERWTGIAHGDFRPGNLIVGADGRIAAVLDWELCTVGDVLADLGWLVAWWRADPDFGWGPEGLPGFAGAADVAARYAEVTGRDVSDLPFFEAFALWRLGCIGHGIHHRYRNGAMGAAGEPIDALARRPQQLADLARDVLHGRR